MSDRMDRSGRPDERGNGPVGAPISPSGYSTAPPLSPQDLEEEQQSSLTDVTQMWIKFAKTFAIILPIYILGYFEFSFSWVLVGLATLFYWRRNHGSKDYRVNRVLAYLDHQERAARQAVPTTELPPWVSVHLGWVAPSPPSTPRSRSELGGSDEGEHQWRCGCETDQSDNGWKDFPSSSCPHD